MRRPKGIPEAATWIEAESCWATGEKNAAGKTIGTWHSWRANGELECIDDWGDGVTRLTYRRLHPDGSVAQQGAKDLARDVWQGVMRWTRQAKASPEDRFFPDMVDAGVRAYEVDLDADGYVITERCFDAKGALVTYSGAPFPTTRPEPVSARAFVIDDDTRWIERNRRLGDNVQRGEQTIWDRNGAVIEHTKYRDDGSAAEVRTYEDGELWMTKCHAPNGDLVQSFFHGTPPIIRSATSYKNGGKDREQTHFDAQGNKVYAVRMEQVTAGHVRRYDQGHLVFDAIWPPGEAKPPTKVAYFNYDGSTLVDYTSKTWRLYASGAVELELGETDEGARSKYGNWDTFMPAFAHYEADREHTDPAAIALRFRERYGNEVVRAQLARLRPSKALAAALGGSWKKVESAFGNADELPRLVRGVLVEDPAIATYCVSKIWMEIEHQTSVYPATYRVAIAFATMLPLEADTPVVQQRLFEQLRDILDLGGIRSNAKSFAALVKALEPAKPLLLAWASATGRRADDALRMLASLGAGTEISAERMRTSLTASGRAYACCTFALAAAPKLRRSTLERAFAAERDPFVRFTLALLRANFDHATTPEVIDAVAPYLVDPSPIEELFEQLVPFFGENAATAIMHALPDAALERTIAPVIDQLANHGSLVQVDHLRVIFRVLFPEGPPRRVTPIQARALSAIARVVAANPNFINHKEVFDELEMPYDSFQLRELAKQTKPQQKPRKQPAKKPASKTPKRPAPRRTATSRTATKPARRAIRAITK